jgi:uncharacterized protein (DUF58 family)
MIDRAIGMAGIALTIVGIVMVTLFPQINRKLAWTGFTLGMVLLGASAVIAFLPEGEAQSSPTVYQAPGSAYSYGQQGGIKVRLRPAESSRLALRGGRNEAGASPQA